MNTLALRIAFSDADINLALAMLQKMELLPPGADKSYFTEGEVVTADLSEMCKDDPENQVGQMCLSLMATMVAIKEKNKENASTNTKGSD